MLRTIMEIRARPTSLTAMPRRALGVISSRMRWKDHFSISSASLADEWHGMLLVFAAPCQLCGWARQEHGGSIPCRGYSTQARNGTCCRKAIRTTKLCIGAFRLGEVLRRVLMDVANELRERGVITHQIKGLEDLRVVRTSRRSDWGEVVAALRSLSPARFSEAAAWCPSRRREPRSS
jgi:hypothetical protein